MADLHVFSIPLTTRFRGIDVREGMLLRGEAGWGEFSPFLEYDAATAAPWLAAAREAADLGFPAPVRDRVPVNVTVPACDPERARAIVLASNGCRTAKVKVAEPGQDPAEDEERLEAVRDALGTGGLIRIDANGGWDVETAIARIPVLDRAAGGLEYVEQPSPSVEDLAAVRRRVQVPIAADESIRRAEDPYRVRDLDAADIAVLKVQPLGGVRACLRIAEDIGLPVVVSSALETSVGIAAGVALAAALPRLEHACGLATVQLLAADVAEDPMLPVDGHLTVRRAEVVLPLSVPASSERTAHWTAPARRGRSRPAGSTPVTATELARAVVEALLAAGVRQVVIAPGSRNAPLSFALNDAAEAGAVDLHTRIDERTGGFLALGMAKTSRAPVAIVTTSGTAAANLHPAVLEAAHAGIGLIAVTADRPARLRGTTANQTTDQVRLFGSAALSSADVVVAGDIAQGLAGLVRGPVHLNVQFDDPLTPPDRWVPTTMPPERARFEDAEPVRLELGPRTVVVAGDDAGPSARVLAQDAGWPLLAEPTSGARNGPNVIRGYRLLLGTTLGERVERAVVVGVPTLSRPVQRLLARDGVEVVARRARGVWADRPHPVSLERDGPFEIGGADDPTWFAEWQAADKTLCDDIDELLRAEAELTPYDVAAEVHAAVPDGGLLVVGASNPIRDLDLMAGAYQVGGRRLVIANRGLAGIDGTLSTALGALLGRPHTTRAIAYVGDVTFLHDLTGLVTGTTEARPDLTIVVANDDGGSIFATLEQGDPAYAEGYDKLFGTPHGVDLEAICTGLRIPHWRVHDRAELAQALAHPNGGIEVVEARLRRDNRRELDARIRDLA